MRVCASKLSEITHMSVCVCVCATAGGDVQRTTLGCPASSAQDLAAGSAGFKMASGPLLRSGAGVAQQCSR